MLLNSLIYLLLSNSITSRRDKSILYSRATIIILLISFLILNVLKWDFMLVLALLLLTLGVIMVFYYKHHNPNEIFYYNGDILGGFTLYYLNLVEKAIADSPFNDTFISINFIIGLSMIIVGLLNKDTESVKDKLIFIMQNIKIIFMIILIMFFVVFTINILLFLVGLEITVDTSSPTHFIYTFFGKVVSIKLIISLISCYITKEFKLNNVSLSIPSILLMFLTGSINYFYLAIYIKVAILLCLTKLDSLRTCTFEIATTKLSNDKTLAEGIFSIITKFPFIGKYVGLLTNLINQNGSNDRSSPCRIYYPYTLKNTMNIYPLTKISKFIPIFMPLAVENTVHVSYLHKGIITNLAELLKNNSLYISGLISKFVSNYSNLTCKINLRCSDEFVTICTTYINGHIEEFNINRTSLNFDNQFDKKGVSNIYSNSKFKHFSTDSFYTRPKYNRDYSHDHLYLTPSELLNLTNPVYNRSYLQVFMQQGISNYDYHVQEAESFTGDPSYLNRGVKRKLEPGNIDMHECTYIPKTYPCIEIGMIKLEDIDSLFLRFDSAKLSTERDRYLDEICFIGRTVLFDHYIGLNLDPVEVSRIVDNYTFKDIVVSASNDIGNLGLYNAFIEKHSGIIKLNEIEPHKICPFSKFYLDNDLYYSDNDGLDDPSSSYQLPILHYPSSSDPAISNDLATTTDYTDVGQKDLTEKDLLILRKELKIRTQKLYTYRRLNGDSSNMCLFLNLNVYSSERRVLERNNQINVFTQLLGKFADENPYYLKINGDLYIPRVGVRYVYLKIMDLVRKPLTRNEITVLINGLESRRDNVFEPTNSNDSRYTSLVLGDIVFTIGKVLLEKDTHLVEPDFTCLLENLWQEKPNFFNEKTAMKTKIHELIANLVKLQVTKP